MRIWWQQQHSYHRDSVNEMLRRGVSDCLLSAHTLMKQLYFQDCISFLVDREKERERVVEDKPIIVQRLTPACILLRHGVSPSSVSSLCNWISSNTRVNGEQTERERDTQKKEKVESEKAKGRKNEWCSQETGNEDSEDEAGESETGATAERRCDSTALCCSICSSTPPLKSCQRMLGCCWLPTVTGEMRSRY